MMSGEKNVITSEEIADAGMERKELAAVSGISYTVLSRKMCGFDPFKPEEIKKIRAILAEHKRKATAK